MNMGKIINWKLGKLILLIYTIIFIVFSIYIIPHMGLIIKGGEDAPIFLKLIILLMPYIAIYSLAYFIWWGSEENYDIWDLDYYNDYSYKWYNQKPLEKYFY